MKQYYKKRRTGFRLITCMVLMIIGFNSSLLLAQSCTPPGASIATPGIITCGNRTVTISGSSNNPGVFYTWKRPDGSMATIQNLDVSIPGTYLLTVTTLTGGCTSTASVVVQQDTVQPNARTSVSGIITCATPTVAVNGISSTQNTTFRWIGPGTFTSNQQNLSVSEYGGYTLMVTSTVNGCTSTATAYVDKNIDLPLASAYVSGDLNCLVNSVQLTSSSPTTGVSYSWTGTGFPLPVTAQNTTTSVGGNYSVTATNPANGCASTASVNVVQDIAAPGATITASANTITCTTINATLSGSSNSIGVTYVWNGPGYSNTAVQNITVATAGSYSLTVTKAQSGCASTTSTPISVDKTRPDVVGTAPSGPLTCATSTITLNGSSNTTGVSYKWMGPSGFGTVYSQNPTTSIKGGYVLFVTNTSNGCMTSKAVSVVEDKAAPSSPTATPNGMITCTVPSVTITGYSSTTGVTYAWAGPSANYTGTTPLVNEAGNYTLTVTNPGNGCSISTSTTVLQDKAIPASVTAANDGTITCLKTSSTLSGSSATQGVNYEWKDQTGTSIAKTQNAVVTKSGIYRLYVTTASNGCQATTITSVSQNTTKPALITASNGGPLTCSLVSTRLNASSSTSGVTYNWSGPSNFISTAINPSVAEPGTYKVIITNSANGCNDSTYTVLTKDVTEPGASIAPPQLMTCNNPTINLSGSSTLSGVTFNWTGPQGFTSTEQNPVTNKPGTYNLTVINSSNNCNSLASITVDQDITTPTGVTAAALDSLTCTKTVASLVGNSGTGNVNFAWTGPNFTSSVQNPTVTSKGLYILTVTKQSNGCKATANAIVVKDTLPPANLLASSSGILNCVNPTVTLTGSSTTPGVAFSWIGPGTNSSAASVSTGTQGTYYLTATNPHNGCSASTSLALAENHTAPTGVSTSVSGTLYCNATTRTITATASPTNLNYSWTGPKGFVSNEQTSLVSEPGTYSVLITHPESKCTVSKNVSVLQDTASPVNVKIQVSGAISCKFPSSTLTGSTNSSPVSYSWTGPNGYTSGLIMPVVTKAGLYALKVANTTNGCSITCTAVVQADTVHPDVSAFSSNNLDCSHDMDTLTGSTSPIDASLEWFYLGSSYDINPVTYAFEAGDYTLVATHPTSGCTSSAVVTVIDNHTLPICALSVPDNSNVFQNTSSNISTYYSTSYSYDWKVTNWSILSGQGTQLLSYMTGNTGSTSQIKVVLKDNDNGCTDSCSVNLTAVSTKSAFAGNFISSQSVNGVDLSKASRAEYLSLKAYPVPSKGKISIEFVSPEQTMASIIVYNVMGSVVSSLFNDNVEANQQIKLNFNESETLPAGVYICVLKTNAQTITKRMSIK